MTADHPVSNLTFSPTGRWLTAGSPFGDDHSGTLIHDASRTEGLFDQALELDGSGDYVEGVMYASEDARESVEACEYDRQCA